MQSAEVTLSKRVTRALRRWTAHQLERLTPTQREGLSGWLFASPWVLGLLLWRLGPMIASLVLSFTHYDLLTSPRLAGLENYHKMFSDPLVLQSFKVTTLYALVAVPLQIGVGLSLAVLLNYKLRGMRLYRTLFYLPAVLSGIAVSLMWRWILATDFGLLNVLLAVFGIKGPGWLSDTDLALGSIVALSLWQVGSTMVIYLAGLQTIPAELYEASSVDGARGWHRFHHITLPLMTPMIFFELIIGLIKALQTFTQPYVLTGGGPQNATRFAMLYIYEHAFEYFHMGYASALSWLLFLYALALTALVLRSSSSWVYYEAGAPPRR